MIRRIGLIVATLGFVLLLGACACEHKWEEANCLVPKTCANCGEIEGEALGHTWNAATCQLPEMCSRCEVSRGITADHIWMAANCENPRTCSVCTETIGVALGHTEGPWKTQSTDIIDATVTSKKFCTVCAAELNEQTVPLQSLNDSAKFIVSPEDFVCRFAKKLENELASELKAYSGTSQNEFACGVYNGENQVGIFLFADDIGTIKSDAKQEQGFISVLGTVDDADTFADVMIALVLCADPLASFAQAKEIGMDALNNGSRTENGIAYAVSVVDSGAIIAISVAE